MPDINTIFGDEISVDVQPRHNQVSYHGFAAAHGMTGLMHGSRGYPITVRGRLRTTTGLTYNQARLAMINLMEGLEAWQYVADAIWTYRSEAYWYTRVERVVMVPDPRRIIHFLPNGSAVADFVATLRSLL